MTAELLARLSSIECTAANSYMNYWSECAMEAIKTNDGRSNLRWPVHKKLTFHQRKVSCLPSSMPIYDGTIRSIIGAICDSRSQLLFAEIAGHLRQLKTLQHVHINVYIFAWKRILADPP